MHRIIVLSGQEYFSIINAAFGKEIANLIHANSICISKNKYGLISYTFFQFHNNPHIITDIKKRLTKKEIEKLLILMNIMGTKAAFNTLF